MDQMLISGGRSKASFDLPQKTLAALPVHSPLDSFNSRPSEQHISKSLMNILGLVMQVILALGPSPDLKTPGFLPRHTTCTFSTYTLTK